MNVYRAYFLDEDGKISTAPTVLKCASDEQALQLAKPMVDGHDIEIWHGSRFVTLLQREEK